MNVLDFIEMILPYLAEQADGKFIDPYVYPKDKRETYTKESYTKEVLSNIEWWRNAPELAQTQALAHLKAVALAAADEQFTAWRDVASILRTRPVDRSIDEKKKANSKQIRDEQDGMAEFDMKRKCASCGLFLYMYDERNNKRHAKAEICTCKASVLQQNRMKAKIKAYRDGLAEKKKRGKKDPERYK